jgi:hypothetical protein
MRKMHADSLPELVMMATRLGLLPVGDSSARRLSDMTPA